MSHSKKLFGRQEIAGSSCLPAAIWLSPAPCGQLILDIHGGWRFLKTAGQIATNPAGQIGGKMISFWVMGGEKRTKIKMIYFNFTFSTQI